MKSAREASLKSPSGKLASKPTTKRPTAPRKRATNKPKRTVAPKKTSSGSQDWLQIARKWTWVPVAVLAAGVSTWAMFYFAVGDAKGPGTGKKISLNIPGGLNSSEVADFLEKNNVISSASLFRWYVASRGGLGEYRAGTHLLRDDLTANQLIKNLKRLPQRLHHKVTLPEGYTRFDIAKRLEEQDICSAAKFLKATSEPILLKKLDIPADSAEGYLFPATYSLAVDSHPVQIVERLVQETQKRITKLLAHQSESSQAVFKQLGWGGHQLVILASMVEKEAGVDEERPMIASVFINRFLDPEFQPKPPRLQSDPTAGYGCVSMADKIPSCANYRGKITSAINKDQNNPYSTYVHPGLPPGPIANPGEHSLQAVLVPAESKYVYFVARGGGKHQFSTSLREHNAAIKHLRRRQGH
jgi:UPF0755 protein